MRESQLLSQDEFERRILKLNPQIDILSKYNGYSELVTFKCKTHNQIYTQRAGDALHGKSGCTQCISSKGEKKIESILKRMDVEFKMQYKFEDCCDVNPLPFDFFVFSNNTAIEYQGEQHYRPVQFGGMSIDEAEKKYKIQKRHDEIKLEYCRKKGIKLLLISYKEFDDLEKIIKNNM